MKYHLGSLFSGAGGLDLGFKLTGVFQPKFAVELLDSAVETYSKNFDLPINSTESAISTGGVFKGDVKDLNFLDVNSDIDILVGGPPCQDFSVVRGPQWDRKGIKVKRGKLYKHFIRALKSLKPALFVFENVPGLKSSNQGIAYRVILKDFTKCGWVPIYADVVDSARLGVPQRRRRLIVVGMRRNLVTNVRLNKANQILSNKLNSQVGILARFPITPIEVFEGKPLPELSRKYRDIMYEYEELLGRQNWNIVDDYLKINRINSFDSKELEKAFYQHELILREMEWLNMPVNELDLPDGTSELSKESPTVLARMGRITPNGNHEMVRGTKWEVEGRGISLIYRRLHPLKPAYTVVAYGGGGTWGYHYERSRSKLTHRERARLQTFPDWFLFYGGSQQIRAQIGEAVPPLLAKRIAEGCHELLADIK